MPSFPSLARQHFRSLTGLAIFLIVVLLTTQWTTRFSSTKVVAPGQDFGAEYAQALAEYNTTILADPIKTEDFGKLGRKLRIVKQWMHNAEKGNGGASRDWEDLADKSISTLLPFLRHPASTEGHYLQRLRSTFLPGSRGIVIPMGKKNFRFGVHLIHNLRDVLHSQLPIEIAYAGDDDLPAQYRTYIVGLSSQITTLDIKPLFDETITKLDNSGWAVKAFAALGSTFEQVILLDADAIFLQKPEVILDQHPKYKEQGALLFHDRLLWQGAFKERHAWWEKELAGFELSDTIKQSKVYMDGYAEEGDSGVIAVDKSRIDVLVGLLHIGWQNTYDPRETYTYRQGHGDKESWWFGFELTGSSYAFEQHYATIIGHVTGEDKVCGFTIAHIDHKKKLLWYNGSLLKNKEVSLKEFDIPPSWMVDGTWEKGATKQDLSCMVRAPVQSVDEDAVEVIKTSVEKAKEADARLAKELPESVPF